MNAKRPPPDGNRSAPSTLRSSERLARETHSAQSRSLGPPPLAAPKQRPPPLSMCRTQNLSATPAASDSDDRTHVSSTSGSINTKQDGAPLEWRSIICSRRATETEWRMRRRKCSCAPRLMRELSSVLVRGADSSLQFARQLAAGRPAPASAPGKLRDSRLSHNGPRDESRRRLTVWPAGRLAGAGGGGANTAENSRTCQPG